MEITRKEIPVPVYKVIIELSSREAGSLKDELIEDCYHRYNTIIGQILKKLIKLEELNK